MGLFKKAAKFVKDVQQIANVSDSDFDANRPLSKADEKAYEAKRAEERQRKERGQ